MRILKLTQSKGYKSAARTLDWCLAYASIPFAVWWVYGAWPAIDGWGWVAIGAVPISFLLAWFDWQAALEAKVRQVLFRRRG